MWLIKRQYTRTLPFPPQDKNKTATHNSNNSSLPSPNTNMISCTAAFVNKWGNPLGWWRRRRRAVRSFVHLVHNPPQRMTVGLFLYHLRSLHSLIADSFCHASQIKFPTLILSASWPFNMTMTFCFNRHPDRSRVIFIKDTPRELVVSIIGERVHLLAFSSSIGKLLTNELRGAVNTIKIITYRTFHRVLTQSYWQPLYHPPTPLLSACPSGTS